MMYNVVEVIIGVLSVAYIIYIVFCIKISFLKL